MAIFSRSRTAAGAGTLAILVLVLAFGNQAYTEWTDRHTRGVHTAWDLFLTTLAWPKWSFTGSNVLANDLRALLLIILVAAILAMSTGSTSAGAGTFFLGWFAVILGAALAAMLTAFLVKDTSSLYWALRTAQDAAGYGLFVGWIVGLATTAGKRGGD
jgi:hypothetical protein